MPAARKRRRECVVELVARHRVTSQEQLQQLLRDQGIEATQATISRDLRDLGITKGSNGYVRMTLDQLTDEDTRRLRQVMKQHVQSITPAGTIVVMRTTSGHASELAALIDRAKLPQCIGAIGGDDTVFITTRSIGQASELGRMLQHLIREDAFGQV
jgi:transcriptional regulator of arginine metabolism